MRLIPKSFSSPDAETVFFFFAICLLIGTVPMDALAGNQISATICKVVNLFQGQAGRNVASLAIIIVGFGALMGKISAGLCVIVCVGIAFIFGAAPIVTLLTGNAGGCAPPPGCSGGPTSAIENVLSNAIDLITGRAGKAIATVAVIIVGLGALYGKVSWPLAIIVALGIALIFGSFTLLKALVGCRSIETNTGSML